MSQGLFYNPGGRNTSREKGRMSTKPKISCSGEYQDDKKIDWTDHFKGIKKISGEYYKCGSEYVKQEDWHGETFSNKTSLFYQCPECEKKELEELEEKEKGKE